MNRLLVLVLLFSAALPGAVYGLDLRPELDPLARHVLADHIAVGFAVGIFKDGQTQVIPYGETKKGSGITPTGDTVYEIGSITKVFTGILLADLINRGIVKLDARVQDYLPASVKVPINGEPITLAHLVTHTSGLPRNPDNLSPVDKRNPFADYTVKQMYQVLRWRPPRPPGQYQYSNFGMGLLGHVLTLQTNEPYEQLLLERICTPLGMEDTRPNPTAGMRERLAPPYDEYLRHSNGLDLPTLAGAGGIRSTVNDMLKFIKANLAKDNTPLSQAIARSHGKLYTMKDGRAIAMAWNISRNGQILSHTGLTKGYRAWLAVVPSRNLGVVVLANTRDRRILQFGDQVTRIALDPRLAEKPAPAQTDSK